MSVLDEPKVCGYLDGLEGRQAESLEAEYQHGWNNGIADRTGEPDAEQRLRAHFYLKKQRADAMIRQLERDKERRAE